VSTLKADTISAATTDGDLTVQGDGTGVPDLAAGVKVGGSTLLPVSIANGGTGSTSTTYCDLTSNVTGTLPVGNGGTGATSLTLNSALLGNGTSAPLEVAPSTSGNVLTSNGTTWQSTAPAGGGAWSYISGVTVTEVAQIDFTGLDSTYEVYMFVFHGVMSVASNNVNLNWRFGTGSGPTYDTSTHYSYALNKSSSQAAATYESAEGEQQPQGMICDSVGPGPASGGTPTNPYSYFGQVYLSGHASSTQHARLILLGSCMPHSAVSTPAPNKVEQANGVGLYNQTTAVTAIRFYCQNEDFSSENSPTIKMYGLAPS
jgi:hypothetical protein